MEREQMYNAAYSGSKNYTQHNVKTANANGFGAAADDYAERGIDLNEQLILNKPATFFFRMNGDAMTGAGINSGDVLIDANVISSCVALGFDKELIIGDLLFINGEERKV